LIEHDISDEEARAAAKLAAETKANAAAQTWEWRRGVSIRALAERLGDEA
jgi:hypothetical protein